MQYGLRTEKECWSVLARRTGGTLSSFRLLSFCSAFSLPFLALSSLLTSWDSSSTIALPAADFLPLRPCPLAFGELSKKPLGFCATDSTITACTRRTISFLNDARAQTHTPKQSPLTALGHFRCRLERCLRKNRETASAMARFRPMHCCCLSRPHLHAQNKTRHLAVHTNAAVIQGYRPSFEYMHGSLPRRLDAWEVWDTISFEFVSPFCISTFSRLGTSKQNAVMSSLLGKVMYICSNHSGSFSASVLPCELKVSEVLCFTVASQHC